MTNSNWCNICRPSINGLFVAISDNSRKKQERLGDEYTLKIGKWLPSDRKTNKLKFKGRLLSSGEYFNTKYSIYQMPLGSIIVHWHHLRHTPEEADYALLDKLPGAGVWILNGKFGGTEKIPGTLLQSATKESIKPWIN